jgi:hypothetical protein
VGPELGKSHDMTLLSQSHLIERLMPYIEQNDTIYFLFGEKAYRSEQYIMTPTRYDTEYNTYMSQLRIIAEWGFQKILQYFCYVDYKKDMKIELSPTAAEYKIATLFANMHTCIRQTSLINSLFNSHPPSVEAYLNP